MRHHGERKIDVPRIFVMIQQREPFYVGNVDRRGVQANPVAWVLDEPDLPMRVRAELLCVVV